MTMVMLFLFTGLFKAPSLLQSLRQIRILYVAFLARILNKVISYWQTSDNVQELVGGDEKSVFQSRSCCDS